MGMEASASLSHMGGGGGGGGLLPVPNHSVKMGGGRRGLTYGVTGIAR